MASQVNATPMEQASIPRFFYQQITYKPIEVRNVSLKDKTAIVTGANSGVGFETSRQLLSLGLSQLILAVRDEGKGQAAAAKLSVDGILESGFTIEVWYLDLSVYDSIVAFTEKAKGLARLDIVVLNAGIAPATLSFNPKTGHSECIQVNYLSTALLAILLLPILKDKRANQPEPSRMTFVSSEAAGWTSFKEKNEFPLLQTLDKPGNTNMIDHMCVSKLLGQFFIIELARMVPPSIALINSASPATVHDSGFNSEHDKTFVGAIAKMLMKLYANTAPVGARMITDAVVNHGVETHGHFLSFQKLAP